MKFSGFNTTEKIGIGTNDPGRPLHVRGAGNSSVVRVGDGDTDGAAAIAYIEFGANSTSWNRHSYVGSAGADSHLWIVNEENADILFYANNAEKMVIKNDGNVGINTTAPSAILHIRSSGTARNVFYVAASDNGHLAGIYEESDGRGALNVRNAGGTATINLDSGGNSYFTGGNFGIGTTAPGSLLTISGNSDDGDDASALRIIDEDSTGGSKLPAIMFYGGSTIQGRIRGGDGTFAIAVGSTPTTALSIDTSTRKLTLNTYGSGTHTGTSAYKLSVDSSGNIIETSIGSGAVDGAGTANYISKWTDGDTIGNSIIYDDGTNDVGIGVVPTAVNTSHKSLQIGGNVNIQSYGTKGASGEVDYCHNVYLNQDGNYKLISADEATMYRQGSGKHTFYSWASGTAGSNVSANAAATKLIILQDGKVGIGTTAPSVHLDVYTAVGWGVIDIDGASGGELRFQRAGTTHLSIFANHSGSLGSNIKAESHLYLATNNSATPTMTLTSAYKVGIGTTSPATPLHVWSTSYPQFRVSYNSALYFTLDHAATLNVYGNDWYVRLNGSEKFRIKQDGKIGIGTNNPLNILTLHQAAGANIRFQNATTGRYFIVGEGVGANDKFSFRGNSYRSTDTLTVDFTNNRVGVANISPSYSLDVTGTFRATGAAYFTGQAYLDGGLRIGGAGGSSYAFAGERLFTIPAFPNGVANQKVDLYWTGQFWGYMEIEITGSYTNQNMAGVLTKSFALGLNANNSIIQNESWYSNLGGHTYGSFAISDVTWDSTNSRYRIQIVHRTSTGNTVRLKLRCLGDSASQTDTFMTGTTVSAIYTTDTTAFATPVKELAAPNDNAWFNGGYLGIGTSTPSELLDIETGGGGGHVELNNPDSGGNSYVIGVTDTGAPGYGVAGSLFIRDGGNSRFVLTSSGCVGIGTIAPAQKLHIYNGRIAVSDGYNIGDPESNNGMFISGDSVQWQTGGTTMMKLQSTGYVDMDGASQVRLTLGSQGTAGSNDCNWIRGTGTSLGFNAGGGSFHWEVSGAQKMSLSSTGALVIQDALTVNGNISNAAASAYYYLNNVGTGNSGLYVAGLSSRMRFHVPASNYYEWEIGGAHKMRLNADGNVGIGTTAPSTKLQVNDTSDSRLLIYETGASPYTATLELASQAVGTYGALIQYTSGAERLTIQNYGRTASNNSNMGGIAFKTKLNNTTPTEVMSIHGFSGNVGIGDITPSYKLDVNGTFRVTGAATFDSSIGFATVLAGNGTASLPSFAFTNDPNTGMYNDGANDNLKFSTGGVIRAFLSATQWSVTGNLVASGNVQGVNGVFSGNITTSTTLSTFADRIKIITGSDQLNIGQWDTANHRIEADANRPLMITSYQGNINLGISGNTRLNVHDAGIATTGNITATGKLTVGSSVTATSKAQIHSTQSNTMTDAEAFLALKGNGGDGMLMGQTASSPYGAWIQAGYLPNIGTSHHYPLILQPHGSNVGIGTTAPGHPLVVVTPTGDKGISLTNSSNVELIHMRQEAGDSGAIGLKDGGNVQVWLTSRPSSNSYFNVSGANFGIGTNSPAAKLDIAFPDNTSIWRGSYASSEDNFYLELDTFIPSGGVVAYSFDLKNNGTAYNNNLVLDRGKVGIGITNPTRTLQVAGAAHATSHLVGSLTTALGIAGSFPDANDSELGPGYLVMTRDDTAAAKQLQFWKNGSLHSGLMTDTNGLNFVGSDGAADVTIKTDGKVGIGTNAPTKMLEVEGSEAEIRVHDTYANTNATLISIGSDLHNTNTKDSWITFLGCNATNDRSWAIGNRASGFFNFTYIGTRATLPSTGGGNVPMVLDGINNRVGIGTTAPANTLHVNGQTRTGYVKFMHNDDSTLAGYVGSGNDLGFGDANDLVVRGNDSIKFTSNNGQSDAMTIDVNGDVKVGDGTTSTAMTPKLTVFDTKTVTNTTGDYYDNHVIIADLQAASSGNNYNDGRQMGLGFACSTAAGGNPLTVASIRGVKVGTTNNHQTGELSFCTSGTPYWGMHERMRITYTGKVGIGTVTPAAQLHIIGPSAASSPYISECITIAPSNIPARTLQLRYDDGGSVGNAFSFAYAGTRAMMMVANGNFGIGNNSSPTQALEIYKAGNDTQVLVHAYGGTNNSTQAGIWFRTDNSSAASYARSKGAVIFQRTGSYGVGNLHLCVQSNANNSSAAVGDSKVVIEQDGNVGIGTNNAAQKLEVNGNILINAQILTPSGSNLQLNPNTGLVTVGGALTATGNITGGAFGPIVFTSSTQSIKWPNTSGQSASRSWGWMGEQGAYGYFQLYRSDASDGTLDTEVMRFRNTGNAEFRNEVTIDGNFNFNGNGTFGTGANGAGNSGSIPAVSHYLRGYSVQYNTGGSGARLTNTGFLTWWTGAGWTSNERMWSFTNAYNMSGSGGPRFALLKGSNNTTIPTLGDNGALGTNTSEVCYWDKDGVFKQNGDINLTGDIGVENGRGVRGPSATEQLILNTTDGIKLTSGGTERVRIKTDGNVIIGGTTSNLSYDKGLQITSASNVANLKLKSGSSTGFDLWQDTGGSGYVIVHDNAPLYLKTNNVTRLTISAGGGITLANNQILSVGTGASNSSGKVRLYGGSGTAYYMDYQPVGTQDRNFRFNGSSSGSAYTTYFNQQGSGNHNLYVDGDITSAGTGRYIYAVNLNVTGYKNFEIEHPTKENTMLVHSSLEGPEAGVYYRGRAQSDTITLPDYWTGLVRDGTITVQLTPNGSFQHLYVVSTSLSEIKIGAAEGETIDCYYIIYGERADVAPLVVEDAAAWERFQERKSAMSDGKA